MIAIAYTSPFVPAEWIAAHGLRPWRVLPRQRPEPSSGLREGLCPFAQAFIGELAGAEAVSAAVFTTTCDQMRRAPELLAERTDLPVFLLNVPATWQTPSAADMYLNELRRLGRFLQRVGGHAPTSEQLSGVMIAYESARTATVALRPQLSARQFAERLCRLSHIGADEVSDSANGVCVVAANSAADHGAHRDGIPIALVGGPLDEDAMTVLDILEQSGGRVVLDGTETGERSLPGAFDRRRMRDDPLAELARAYFGAIPDAFRRPDTMLYEWLRTKLDERRPRGLVIVRQVWCDLWHAEAGRLKEWAGLPVLDLDVSGAAGAAASLSARIQAFLEVLR